MYVYVCACAALYLYKTSMVYTIVQYLVYSIVLDPLPIPDLAAQTCTSSDLALAILASNQSFETCLANLVMAHRVSQT